MRSRRVLTFLLGAWLMGVLFITQFVSQGTSVVERTLENQNHPAVRQIMTLGAMEARTNLRYFTTEIARSTVETWEWLQLVILLLVAGILLMSRGGSRWTIVCGLALALCALVERFFLTPEMLRLGRQIDVLPPTLLSGEQRRFYTYATWYQVLQGVMVLMGLAVSLRLLMTDTIRRMVLRGSGELEENWDNPAPGGRRIP